MLRSVMGGVDGQTARDSRRSGGGRRDGVEEAAIDEELEEVGLGLKLDALDAADELARPFALTTGQQEHGGPAKRGVADLFHALGTDLGEEADGDGSTTPRWTDVASGDAMPLDSVFRWTDVGVGDGRPTTTVML